MRLTVVFEDYRVETKYANGHISNVDFYTDYDGEYFSGNTTTKNAFTTAVTNAGHNMDDYWAIQYFNGQQEIEYANNHPNQVISSNTGLSVYADLANTWKSIIDAENAEQERLDAIPTWDEIRADRDERLLTSDKIIAWSTETGNSVPSAWTTYRQDLRDITTTYNAPTGNTELVVFPSEPSWPTS